MRGDVPVGRLPIRAATLFSPRARGCSLLKTIQLVLHIVFPACAGMFPAPHGVAPLLPCFPRVRGDVPSVWVSIAEPFSFSPRARGCSLKTLTYRTARAVFPACAGMFRSKAATKRTVRRFPRVRGDIPFRLFSAIMRLGFSPRARGCSVEYELKGE